MNRSTVMLFCILTVFCFMAPPCNSVGETSIDPLHGKVIDQSNDPVPSAKVYSSRSYPLTTSLVNDSATTDIKGVYTIKKGFFNSRENSLQCGSDASPWSMNTFFVYVVHPQYDTVRVVFISPSDENEYSELVFNQRLTKSPELYGSAGSQREAPTIIMHRR